MAEFAVLIKLRLSETHKSGKMQPSLHKLRVLLYFVQFAEIQSFPKQVLARHSRNTSVQPYQDVHMYACIQE